jgi:(1->4)-alpha-D-glucan 1-alpha-D-glucosylmutase
VVLKFTAPGVPDLYQGCEQWNFSLVDPDNRRPVDYAALARDLESVESLYRAGWPSAQAWHALDAHAADGRIKQLVTWRLTRLRRERSLLFRNGSYLPLPVEGEAAEHAVAFARIHEREAVLVVVARLTCTLCNGEDGAWSPALWQDTRVRCGGAETSALRRFPRWRNWLTGATAVLDGDEEAGFELRPLFEGAGELPFVVLVAEAEA